MRINFNRSVGLVSGVLLGSLWTFANAWIARYAVGSGTTIAQVRYYRAWIIIVLLSAFGFALGRLCEHLWTKTHEAERHAQELRQLNHLKDEFITTASHELRTPLTVVRALAQLALMDARAGTGADRDGGAGREVANNLESIIAQTDLMTGLLNQLLDASRLGATNLTLNRQPLLLPELVDGEIRRLRALSESHTIVVDLSALVEPWQTVLVDSAKLSQVLGNLVNNAVRYSPDGSSIVIAMRDVSGGMEVSVQDDGIGVPPDDREAVFAKFFRADNAKQLDRTGLGLGLYISRKLVEMHGGRIWLDQSRPSGSIFRFTIPYQQTEPTA